MWQLYDAGVELIPGTSIDIIISDGKQVESSIPEKHNRPTGEDLQILTKKFIL